MADVFDQAAKDTKPSKQKTAQASAPRGGDVFDQAAVAVAPPEQTQGMPLAPDAWGRMKQAYEGNLPLLDENMATLSGVGTVARGTVGAAKGIYDLLRESLKAWNDPRAEVGDIALPRPQIEQVPGAIRDINASADPYGSYLKAGQETAGQGAGAALTALATEGAGRTLPKAIEAVGDIPVGRITKATGAGIKAGAGKFPIVGPPVKAATLAAIRSWQKSAPGSAGQLANSITAPEVNPAVVSPSRTLPGMNPPEVIRPPAQPIPQRSGLMLPGETERIIPASKVSTTPPKSSPMSKADVISRVRSIAQQPGTGVTTSEPSGPQTLIAGKPIPANADLTAGLKVPSARLQGKIMQALREETGGKDLTVGIDRLMQSPKLKGISREQIIEAAHKLGDSGKVWKDEVESGPQAGLKGISLRKP